MAAAKKKADFLNAQRNTGNMQPRVELERMNQPPQPASKKTLPVPRPSPASRKPGASKQPQARPSPASKKPGASKPFQTEAAAKKVSLIRMKIETFGFL